MNPTDIKGYGFDADPANRPGIPMERPLQPLPHAKPPSQQQTAPAIPNPGTPDKRMPPVFGTAQPPKGLSGALRIYAYKYPAHRTRHWMVLMLADRVDVWEHRLRRAAPFAALLLVGGVTVRLLKS